MMKKNQKNINLVGAQYGRLRVVELLPNRQGKARKWLCSCECGGSTSVTTSDLNRGQTRSCGCFAKEVSSDRLRTHGYASHLTKRTPTWNTWMAMKRRCMDTSNKNYGGKGIRVCDEWMTFENFLKDMGERPIGTSLDRINSNLGYNKDNCRWATPKEQILNTTTVKYLEYNGEKLCTTDMAKKYGLTIHCLSYRLKQGWDLEKALTTPKYNRKIEEENDETED